MPPRGRFERGQAVEQADEPGEIAVLVGQGIEQRMRMQKL